MSYAVILKAASQVTKLIKKILLAMADQCKELKSHQFLVRVAFSLLPVTSLAVMAGYLSLTSIHSYHHIMVRMGKEIEAQTHCRTVLFSSSLGNRTLRGCANKLNVVITRQLARHINSSCCTMNVIIALNICQIAQFLYTILLVSMLCTLAPVMRNCISF